VRERAHRTVGPGDAAFGDLEAAYRFDAPGASAAFEQTANYRFGTLNGGPTRQAFSGARVGQEAVSTTGADAAVGPSGGALAATGVSAGPDGAIQLYRYGAPDGPRRSDGQPGEAIDGTQTNQRSNLTWGAATNGSPSATLTIDYSSVQGVSSPVHLIRRDGPETAWGNADDWTHDSNAQTFTITGTVPEGEYAVKTGPIRSRVYVDADAGTGGDGTSWSNAYSDLQAAIDNAPPGSEIWVAEGVYTPDGEGDSFTITGAKDPLGVYGGHRVEPRRASADGSPHGSIRRHRRGRHGSGRGRHRRGRRPRPGRHAREPGRWRKRQPRSLPERGRRREDERGR
jgi:hypothetical protein